MNYIELYAGLPNLADTQLIPSLLVDFAIPRYAGVEKHILQLVREFKRQRMKKG